LDTPFGVMRQPKPAGVALGRFDQKFGMLMRTKIMQVAIHAIGTDLCCFQPTQPIFHGAVARRLLAAAMVQVDSQAFVEPRGLAQGGVAVFAAIAAGAAEDFYAANNPRVTIDVRSIAEGDLEEWCELHGAPVVLCMTGFGLRW